MVGRAIQQHRQHHWRRRTSQGAAALLPLWQVQAAAAAARPCFQAAKKLLLACRARQEGGGWEEGFSDKGLSATGQHSTTALFLLCTQPTASRGALPSRRSSERLALRGGAARGPRPSQGPLGLPPARTCTFAPHPLATDFYGVAALGAAMLSVMALGTVRHAAGEQSPRRAR